LLEDLWKVSKSFEMEVKKNDLYSFQDKKGKENTALFKKEIESNFYGLKV